MMDNYRKHRTVKILLVAIILGIVLTKPVFAVTLDVDNIPATISASPFSVTISIFGANAGKNYLRVDLFKEGTTNYFGETFNGSEWYTGTTGTSYFPIDIISSNATATATIQAQIGAPTGTDYLGSGQYKLRIRRYTSSSGYSAGNPYDIYIDLPTPTPTETPQPTSTLAPSPTKTSTPTPTSTPFKTSTPIPKSSPTPTGTPLLVENISTESGEVLGLKTFSPTPTAISSTDSNNKSSLIAFGLIGIGVIAIGGAIYLGIKSSKNPQIQNDI